MWFSFSVAIIIFSFSFSASILFHLLFLIVSRFLSSFPHGQPFPLVLLNGLLLTILFCFESPRGATVFRPQRLAPVGPRTTAAVAARTNAGMKEEEKGGVGMGICCERRVRWGGGKFIS